MNKSERKNKMGREGKIAVGILAFFIVIFLIIQYSTTFTYPETALNIIRLIIGFLAILPVLALVTLPFFRRIQRTEFFQNMFSFIIIYYAVLIMMIATNTNLLPKAIPLFSSNIFALAIALIALGLSLLPKESQETELTKNMEKVATLNKKLDKAEKTIDVFLEESQKLGKRLAAIQKEEKGEG